MDIGGNTTAGEVPFWLPQRLTRTPVARSTLADANENHDWRMFADFAQALIAVARPLHADDPIGVELDQTLYALDATTIDLWLSLFPWARFRQGKAAVKVHTLLDLRGSIPAFVYISEGRYGNVTSLNLISCSRCRYSTIDVGD